MFHDLSNMLMMCVEVFVKYKNIVEVNENMSLVYLNMEYIIHHCLESSGGVRKSEEHTFFSL